MCGVVYAAGMEKDMSVGVTLKETVDGDNRPEGKPDVKATSRVIPAIKVGKV